MRWDDLTMGQKSALMRIYINNGVTSLDDMRSHYNSFAEGGFTSPDHDPNNPYHYHVNGQKVVVTPEDWEKYKNDPTFREVRAAVEAEQAAYPEPEYDEVENPAWRKAYQNLVNGVNLRGRSNYLQPLPQGYTRDAKGVAMDAQGNYYLPVETATSAPYFVNQERGMYGNTVPVRYEQQQMPERTIRHLRQPLPVDRVMNVDNEREKAIQTYLSNPANTITIVGGGKSTRIPLALRGYEFAVDIETQKTKNRKGRAKDFVNGVKKGASLQDLTNLNSDVYNTYSREESDLKDTYYDKIGFVVNLPDNNSLYRSPDKFQLTDFAKQSYDITANYDDSSSGFRKNAFVTQIESLGRFLGNTFKPVAEVEIPFDLDKMRRNGQDYQDFLRLISFKNPFDENFEYVDDPYLNDRFAKYKVSQSKTIKPTFQQAQENALIPLFANGGRIDIPPFAKRFAENPPRTIPTSQGNASHFMATDEADGRYYAYPTVQPTDYADSTSPLKYYGDRALDRALENNDVIMFPTLSDAVRYTENYKRPPSTGAYLNNEYHPVYSPYDYVRSFDEGGSPDIPPYWGQPTGQPQGPIDYLSRYVRSQAFEDRAPNDRYVRQARQNVGSFKGVENLNATRYNTGSFANPSEHIIGMFPGKTFTPYAPYDSGFAAPYSSVLAHEFGHIIDPNYVGQRNTPVSYLNLYEQRPQELNDHDSRPQEIYADLQSLRYQLYEKHIYDIINDGAFNEKHLDKALKQEIPNRLLYTMPKETLIQMMNTIADNTQPTHNVADTYVMPTDLGLGIV